MVEAATSFCVFTPTYNRAHLLSRLYDSLLAQDYPNFVWLIIDDGSTDDTSELIESYTRQGRLTIEYHYVENGGKQRAQNLAVGLCSQDLFLCVDSDDWLIEDALQTFASVWETVKDNPSVAGMISPRQISGNEPHVAPAGADLISAWDLYETYGFQGDALHVYRTSLLAEYPLPVAEGEKFISEWYSVNMIAKTHKVKVIHRALQVGEYLPGGYTDRARELARNNPVSYYTNKRLCIEMSKKWTNKCKHTVLYLVGCIFAKKKGAVFSAPNKVLALFCYLPAQVLVHTEFRSRE